MTLSPKQIAHLRRMKRAKVAMDNSKTKPENIIHAKLKAATIRIKNSLHL